MCFKNILGTKYTNKNNSNSWKYKVTLVNPNQSSTQAITNFVQKEVTAHFILSLQSLIRII